MTNDGFLTSLTRPLRIFLSYRRDDTRHAAGRLWNDLAERYGKDRVFLDVATMKSGDRVADVIERAGTEADVLIALIGDRWVDACDELGRLRLEDPQDFVRREIEAALEHELRVIPALVDGAALPSAEQLPDSLRALVDRHAVELGHSRWESDVGRLLEHLDEPSPREHLVLPVPPSPLIGRERELGELSELLSRQAVRLLTLVGPGGTGKTRLALEVASRVAGEFREGVFFVALASIVDPTLVPSEIAQATGTREAAGADLLDTLKDALKARRALLVLDNFEHVAESAAGVAELLAAAAELKVLATSRTPLRLAGESEYPVSGLEEPEAVSLFVARASSLSPGFQLTSKNEATIHEICERLDRLPLALELAASRAKLLPPEQLLKRLESRLELLTAGARDAPARQQTLRAAIAWSYDLLAEGQKQLFFRLAVFAGGFTVESAERICYAALDDLAALVDSSLLWRPSDDRLSMLATIREFALERLEASGEADELRVRHARWFFDLSERAQENLTGAHQADWLERLEQEHDNFRAALEDVVKRGDGDLALQLVARLWRFWLLRGHLSEGRAWFDRALAIRDGSPQLRAEALRGSAALAASQGDSAQARMLSEESVDLSRALGDTRGLARALSNLGNTLADAGELEAAAPLYEESIELLAEIGDEWGVAVATSNRGSLALGTGDAASARILCEESLARFRTLNDSEGMLRSLIVLGFAAVRLGELEHAMARFSKGVAFARDLGDVRDLADLFEGVAACYAAAGEAHRAARLLGVAEGMREPVGAVRESALNEAYEQTMTRLRRLLEANLLAAELREGRLLTFEDALEAAGFESTAPGLAGT